MHYTRLNVSDEKVCFNYTAIVLRCQNPVTSYEGCQRSLLGRFAAKLTNQLSNSSDSPLQYPHQLHPCKIGSRNRPEQGTRHPLPLRETSLARPPSWMSRDSSLLCYPGEAQTTPQVLLYMHEISISHNYTIFNILHKSGMALCPRVAQIKETQGGGKEELFSLSYSQELRRKNCKYFSSGSGKSVQQSQALGWIIGFDDMRQQCE